MAIDIVKRLVSLDDRLRKLEKRQQGKGVSTLSILEGPDIDLVFAGAVVTVGVGLDTIILINSDGSQCEEFAVSAAGFDAALAAAISGDQIRLPSRTIGGNHTMKAGVAVWGMDRRRTILTGLITGIGDGLLANVTIDRDLNDATTLVGVAGPASGTFRLWECVVDVTQAGAGAAYAIEETLGGTFICWDTELYGRSTGGAGYAARSTSGIIELYHGKAFGSTDRFPS